MQHHCKFRYDFKTTKTLNSDNMTVMTPNLQHVGLPTSFYMVNTSLQVKSVGSSVIIPAVYTCSLHQLLKATDQQ